MPEAEQKVELPTVTLVISAFNEEECILQKLQNTAALDYPVDKLEVIVVSDGSTDGTDSIVKEFAERDIVLLRVEGRLGKTVGLNKAVEKSAGSIIVFSDANAMYCSSAINALVTPFTQKSIGAVIGEQAYVQPESSAGESESLYWRYETAIKSWESRTGSVVGGDGAIYAVRKDLYKPMRPDALSDFVNPLQVVKSGHRVVYTRNAVALEDTAEDFKKEFRRKVRIVNRAWRATWSMREMLNPIKYSEFAVKLWSHKVLRWLVPFMLLAIFVINAYLLGSGWIYEISFWTQVTFYATALVAGISGTGNASKVLTVPYYFCLVNLASAVGIIEAFTGKTYTTWTTARNDGNGV